MNELIDDAVGWVVTGAFGITGWVFGMIFKRQERSDEKHQILSKDFEAHKLHVASTFVTKNDVEQLKEGIAGVHKRLDDLITALVKQ